LPVFRFNKAFGIARDLKVFLNLQGGFTRGAVPDVDPYKKQAQKLRNARRKDRQLIKGQRKKIKEQAKTLNYARRRIDENKHKSAQKHQEIFRLKNELRSAEERVKDATKGLPAPQAEGEQKTGALPDFVIIGALKGGTSSLYGLLTRHPHVERAASKELHYFDRNFEKGIEWYRSQFPLPRWKEKRRSITGEATPEYLFHRSAPEMMAKVIPQARLIVLLRNPVDRAYSHYHNRVRIARETRSFEEAIEVEKEWLLAKEGAAPEYEPCTRVERPHVDYLSRGIYVDQLLRWSKHYSQQQMLVLKSEDLFERTLETLKLVLNFLDLPDWEPEAVKIPNEGRYEEMAPATRRRLEEYFEPHNRRLYEYLGVDFGW
jgi:hypothetical protein